MFGTLEKQSIISLLVLLCIVFFVIPDSATPVASAQEASPSSVFPAYVGSDPTEASSSPIDPIITQTPTETESSGPYEYLEITNGCLHGWDGCIIARSGPGENYDEVYEVEKGMLLRLSGTVQGDDGETWYRVVFDEWRRYPERTPKTWYLPTSSGRIIHAGGVETVSGHATTSKRIVVDISKQMLYAYDGDKLFMSTPVSTGEYPTVTPTGTFSIYKKTPTRYMQGPLAGVTDIAFDLPGVPWDMYFTQGGAAIHGTYWNNNYGSEQSDGCVNIPVGLAKTLYYWADLGTPVIVQK